MDRRGYRESNEGAGGSDALDNASPAISFGPEVVLLAVLTLGFACARFSTTSGSFEGIIDHSAVWIALKLAKALVYIALAFFFRYQSFGSNARVVVLGALALFCIHEPVFCILQFGGAENVSLSLFYIATSGANDAMVMFSYLMFMSRFSRGPACLMLGFALNYVLWLLASYLPEPALSACEVVTRTAGMAVLVWFAFAGADRARSVFEGAGASAGTAAGTSAGASAGTFAGVAAGISAGAPAAGASPAAPNTLASALLRPHIVAFMAAIGLLVSTIAGFFISLPMDGNAQALFGSVSHTAAVLMCTLFGLMGLLNTRIFDTAGTLYAGLLLCLVGCLFMPVSWQDESVSVGVMIIRLARLLFEACLWAAAMRAVATREREGSLALGVMLAVSTYYVGVILSLALGDAATSSDAAFAYTGTVVAALVGAALYVLAMIGGSWKVAHAGGVRAGGGVSSIQGAGGVQGTGAGRGNQGAGDGAGAVGETGGASLSADLGAAGASDPSVAELDQRLATFDEKLRRFVADGGFTERETAILVEVIHGHSGEAVGERLGYSRDAVKFSLAKIYAKAGVSNKQELLNAIEAVGPDA